MEGVVDIVLLERHRRTRYCSSVSQRAKTNLQRSEEAIYDDGKGAASDPPAPHGALHMLYPILRHNRILTKHCITSGCRTPTQVNTWSNRILPHQVQLSAVQCITVLSFEIKIKNSTNRDGGRWEIEQRRGKEFFLQRRFSQRPQRRYTTSNRASASVHQ